MIKRILSHFRRVCFCVLKDNFIVLRYVSITESRNKKTQPRQILKKTITLSFSRITAKTVFTQTQPTANLTLQNKPYLLRWRLRGTSFPEICIRYLEMSLFVKRSTFFSEPMAHERVNLMIYSLSWKKLMKICVTKSNFKDWCGFLCQYRNYHFRKERNHFFIFCLGREGLCLLSVLRSLGERRNTQNIFIFSLLKAPLSRSENTGSHHCQFAFIF